MLEEDVLKKGIEKWKAGKVEKKNRKNEEIKKMKEEKEKENLVKR
jgi:hypothetical protein